MYQLNMRDAVERLPIVTYSHSITLLSPFPLHYALQSSSHPRLLSVHSFSFRLLSFLLLLLTFPFFYSSFSACSLFIFLSNLSSSSSFCSLSHSKSTFF